MLAPVLVLGTELAQEPVPGPELVLELELEPVLAQEPVPELVPVLARHRRWQLS